jgi:hypothetical protein
MDANEFQLKMSRLPEPITELKPPYWEYWRWDLYKRVLSDEPTEFWEWPCIYHCMLVEHWPGPIAYELSKLDSRFLNACSIPHFGPGDGELTNDGYLSRNLIHQAYHIQQWEEATGKRINQLDTIVEFGGGYGAMALLCHRLGFDGKYIIYDLPEFALLQEYYLSHFGILHKVEWNPKRKPKNVDLFMALYSMSEMPLDERIPLVPQAKSYLFLYSGVWQGWDNVSFFQRAVPELAWHGEAMQWRHSELSHLPDKNNHYSIGW